MSLLHRFFDEHDDAIMPGVPADAAKGRLHGGFRALQTLHELAILVEQDAGDARLDVSFGGFLVQAAQLRRVERARRSAKVSHPEQLMHIVCDEPKVASRVATGKSNSIESDLQYQRGLSIGQAVATWSRHADGWESGNGGAPVISGRQAAELEVVPFKDEQKFFATIRIVCQFLSGQRRVQKPAAPG